MITALSPTYPNDSSAQAWAQSGYFDGGPGGEDNGLYPHGLSGEVIGYFAQYTNSCKTEKTCGSGPQWTTKIVAASWAGGTSYAFTSKYVPLDQSVNMYANGTLVLYTDYDPTLSWGPSWQAQFAGETYEEESDVLGSTTTKDIYSNLEYVDAAGSFHPFASLRAETPYSSRYRNAVFTDGSGNPAYDTWTP